MNRLERSTISIIGCGRMGSAFASSWQDDHRLLTFDPVAPTPEGCEPLANLTDAPPDGLVLLAVKPQIAANVARQLARVLAPATPVVSIVAGVQLVQLTALLGKDRPVVRAMPNTPVSVRLGASAAIASASVSREVRDRVASLFERTGTFLWLDDERLIDVVTGISGSGPAYFYRFAEALAASAARLGLAHDLALTLARATLAGAGALAARGDDLADLREAVTSPGGTTAAALGALDRDGIDALADGAVRAALMRAGELAAGVA